MSNLLHFRSKTFNTGIFGIKNIHAVFLAVGLVAINLFWFIPALYNVRNTASILAQEIAGRAGDETNVFLENFLADLNRASDLIGADPQNIEKIFYDTIRYNTSLNDLVLLDSSGRAIFYSDRIRGVGSGEKAAVYVKNPSFHFALEGASNFGGITEISPEGVGIIAASPVRSGDKTDFVLLGTLNLKNLQFFFSKISAGRGSIYLVDRFGKSLVQQDVFFYKDVGIINPSLVEKVVTDGLTVDGLGPDDVYFNQEGEKVFSVGTPVKMAGLGIFFEQPTQKAFAGYIQIFIFAFAAFITGFVFFFIIAIGNSKFKHFNDKLQELLHENYISGKMLVQRDRELTAANRGLMQINKDLEMVGKVLVRRDLELTTANQRLTELDRTKSEFVSVAAHQLRTPITAIRWSFSNILEDTDNLSDMQKTTARDGLNATAQMAELIGDLLNVARIEEGRFGFVFKVQPIVQLLQETVGKFRKAADEKGIDIKTEFNAGHLTLCNIDSEKMKLALDNVFDNSVKYTRPGGWIKVYLDTHKGKATIVISDNGIGIPKDQTKKIFDKFFRASNAVLFQTSGSGLGLYVAKNIIERHAGNMFLESDLGVGTTISIILPLVG